MTDGNGSKYRLGLDLGTNSIGWAAVSLDDNGEPCGLLDMGVRIFPDGRVPGSESSNAKTRREARGARRRRGRYIRRRKNLLNALVKYGLMPDGETERKELEKLDPYELRAMALEERKLPLHHVGRAIFHLNQRRGFKSNRKTEKPDKDNGPAKKAITALNDQMSKEQARTLGQFLYRRQQSCHDDPIPIRFRNVGTENKAVYEFYPTRKMLMDEFDEIWKAQSRYHEAMTPEAKESLHHIIFSQGDMTAPPVGKCTLDPAKNEQDDEGFRCPWAHPSAQQFRIYQEVRNLEVREIGEPSRRLSKEEGDKVANALLSQKTVSFDKIRKLLKLPDGAYFNLESERRKELLGDQTAAKLVHKDFFGKEWIRLPLDQQIEIIEKLLDEDINDDDVIEWLSRQTGISREVAERVVSAFLPEGHCRLGLRAIRNILPHMEEEGLNYPDAAKSAGYDHAQVSTREVSPNGRLPYYGEWLKDHLNGTGDPRDRLDKRYGRFPNPTVHIGLNQVRLVVNALIKEYGPPHQAVVEMVRDIKLSKKQRDKIKIEQAANQKKNDDRNKELESLGIAPNPKDRLKMRLWEELNPSNRLDRRCPFTGKVISLKQLFSDEDKIQVEHLIPWKGSYDDSPANKTVAYREANQAKGNQTPFEAFGDTPDWEGIKQRAEKLPINKRWRFEQDAREHFKKQDGFLGRQLNETSWLARLTKEYLSAVVNHNSIWVIPGRLTNMLGHKWGLYDLLPGQGGNDRKERTDHRHHAIDALITALTDRSLLQSMSNAYDEQRSRIKVPTPWGGFHKQVKHFFDHIVVSHKPDHGTPGTKGQSTGQLHNETAYGLVKLSDTGPSEVVTRKKVADFKKRSDLDAVRDPTMREALRELWDEVEAEGLKPADFAERAADRKKGVRLENRRQPVRRVRILDKQTVILIEDSAGKPYKGYKLDSNEFADVWEMPDKKSWKIVAVPTFYANQPDFNVNKFRPHPAAKRLWRLYKNDMGALGQGSDRRIVRVRKFSDGNLMLDGHKEANVDGRERKKTIMRNSGHSASRLRAEGFRKVHVNEIGRVLDPGPRKP